MQVRRPTRLSPEQLRRCAVVIVAYEAESTIEIVLDRLRRDVTASIGAILVSDDASTDRTSDAARRWSVHHPEVDVTVVRQPRNLGYGGNQRWCYRWAAERGIEHVVMIHGDGQYAPELAADLLEPLVLGPADAVFGSRMLDRMGARRGGMPLYKRVGNRVLSGFQNWATGLRLSEWHSGYRAYRVDTLEQVGLDAMSAGFDFDTQIILALADVDATIREVPIPTHYGDEICRVNGLRYAAEVSRDVVRYRRRLVAV